MRARSLESAWAALFACGCIAEPSPRLVEAPTEPLYVGAIPLGGEDGAEGSGLVLWAPGAGLPLFFDQAVDQVVLGFSPAQLELYAPPEEPRWRTLTLRPAVGCEEPLPSPALILKLSGGELTEPNPSERVSVTHPAVTEGCPPAPPRALELSCLSEFCVTTPEPSPDSECAVRYPLRSTCVLPADVQVHAWRSGAYCVEQLDDRGAGRRCEPADGPADARSSWTCQLPDECLVSVHAEPAPEAPFDLERVALLGAARQFVPRASGPELNSLIGAIGHAYDVIELADSYLTTAAPEANRGCYNGNDNDARLVFVDPVSFELTRTATAPACTRFLSPHPSRPDEFFATFAEGPVLETRLGRFSTDGRLLQSASFTSGIRETGFGAGERWQPLDLALVGAPPRLALVLSWDGVAHPGGELRSYDPETLELVGRVAYEFERPSGVLGLPDNRALLIFQELAHVDLIDLTDMTVVQRQPLGELRPGRSALAGLHVGSMGETLFSTQRELRSLSPSGSVQVRSPYERWTDLTDLVSWPGEPDRILVSGIDVAPAGGTAGSGALYSTAQRRFLSGTWGLGHGPVTRSRVTQDGRSLLLVMPWSGELLRLTPRPSG